MSSVVGGLVAACASLCAAWWVTWWLPVPLYVLRGLNILAQYPLAAG